LDQRPAEARCPAAASRSIWQCPRISFSALSFIFASPMIAAVILVEAAGIGGPGLPLIMVPGLLAAGIGSWSPLLRSAVERFTSESLS
jgi:hypothetical protein